MLVSNIIEYTYCISYVIDCCIIPHLDNSFNSLCASHVVFA